VTTLQNKTSSPSRSEASADRRPEWPVRPHVIRAVFKRNFRNYLSNPAGYVFITLFVIVSSLIAFCQPSFFTNNLANLDLLNDRMPYLLLFFVPAITMTAWAEERKQGTDELLFTLPAYDVEIVLGKYLAALGIYTVALAFLILGHVPLLSYLLGQPDQGTVFGRPDLGTLFATYLGYWLMGAMLISVGMVASLLSSNVTIAFILAALFSAIPVFAGLLGSPTGRGVRRQFEELSVPAQFHDFGTGVIPLAGVFYFVSLIAAMLYINMVLIGRRHWAGGEKSKGRWAHALVRIVAVVVALASLNLLVGRTGLRADMSEGKLHTLSRESIALIKQISPDRPVYIQAYYSPEVPAELIETKADLIALLKEYAARGGERIRLNLIETELYSPAAREAEKRFGIEPKRVMTVEEAKQSSAEVLLGVAFTSGLDEVVIPFFDRGLPIEYELTRSIRVVSRTGRKKVGILNTDARLMGGFEMRSMGQTPEWSIVTELKKQYEVSSVAPDVALPTDLDALLVAQPSSLTQKQIDNLVDYVKKGRPALLFLDPFPVDNPQNSPEVPKAPPGGPFGGGQPPEPKGNLQPLLDLIGLDWPTTEIVWNEYNPMPQLAELPPEVVFISKGSGAAEPFNRDQIISSGLQEVVLLFPGLLRPRSGAGPEFTPLLRTDNRGGTINWSEIAQQGMFGISGINPNRRHFPSGTAYTLAARLKGTPAADSSKKAEKPAAIHVIAIADLDLISEQFFEMRRRKIENLDFDNVTFVLNCVDALAGDEGFVGLRKRRATHRTLLRVEAQSKQFIEQRQKETKDAEDAAKEKLGQAQKRLDQQVEAVRARKDIDERAKEIRLITLQEVANRRLDVEKTNIEDEKRRKIQESKAETEQQVRAIQNQIRVLATFVPPMPALVLGLLVFFVRFGRENKGANPNRLA
jgi:ABC-2 type transport system permease protein